MDENEKEILPEEGDIYNNEEKRLEEEVKALKNRMAEEAAGGYSFTSALAKRAAVELARNASDPYEEMRKIVASDPDAVKNGKAPFFVFTGRIGGE